MRFVFWALLFCAACQPIDDQLLVSRDTWTGAQHITVQEREIYRDADTILTVRPVILWRDGVTGYAVLTNLRRRDPNGPRIDRMTSLGKPLAYARLDRLFTHCIDGCQPAETGYIAISAKTFRTAARTGLPLRVWGRRGRAEGTVPAEAFAKVLAQYHGG